MNRVRAIYDRLLEAIAAALIVATAIIVILGVVYRSIGESLVWYDEIASVALCWLTYYAGALAALRGAHIGFAGLVNALPASLRVAATLVGSAVNIFFFGLLAYTGFEVVKVLGGTTLVSIPEVSQQWTQSVIPIAASMFVIAELLRLPQLLQEARQGPLIEHELKEAFEAIGERASGAGGEHRP
jgi:TRAP-type C4-dicarboxylate transport system permease small subunit